MDTNKPPLAARNFPTAEEEAAVAAEPSRYALSLIHISEPPRPY